MPLAPHEDVIGNFQGKLSHTSFLSLLPHALGLYFVHDPSIIRLCRDVNSVVNAFQSLAPEAGFIAVTDFTASDLDTCLNFQST